MMTTESPMVMLQVVPLILDKAGLCLRITPCMYINLITWYLLIKLYKSKHPSTHWLCHPVLLYIFQRPIRSRELLLYIKQGMRACVL